MEKSESIKWLDKIEATDTSLVGHKFANLGQLFNMGINVPFGFCVTTTAFRECVQQSDLSDLLSEILTGIRYENLDSVKDSSQKIKAAVINREIYHSIKDDITKAYVGLRDKTNAGHFAVRSSCTCEDLPGSSFAGQYDTYLGIHGIDDILLSVKKCWASLWNERALIYRKSKNIEHSQAWMAVIVQSMIPCEQSGIVFTANPISNDPDQIMINAAWGLGDAIVSGKVAADEYCVNKINMEIRIQKIGDKHIKLVQRSEGIEHIQVARNRRKQKCLTDKQIKSLASIGLKLEEHFGCPQDIEWSISDRNIYLFQTRDITTLDKKKDVLKKIINDLGAKKYDPKTVWSNTLLSEILPSPTPLTWHVIKRGLSKEGSFGVYEKEVGLGKVASDGLLDLIGGQPYYNMNKLCDTFSFYGFPTMVTERRMNLSFLCRVGMNNLIRCW